MIHSIQMQWGAATGNTSLVAKIVIPLAVYEYAIQHATSALWFNKHLHECSKLSQPSPTLLWPSHTVPTHTSVSSWTECDLLDRSASRSRMMSRRSCILSSRERTSASSWSRFRSTSPWSSTRIRSCCSRDSIWQRDTHKEWLQPLSYHSGWLMYSHW